MYRVANGSVCFPRNNRRTFCSRKKWNLLNSFLPSKVNFFLWKFCNALHLLPSGEASASLPLAQKNCFQTSNAAMSFVSAHKILQAKLRGWEKKSCLNSAINWIEHLIAMWDGNGMGEQWRNTTKITPDSSKQRLRNGAPYFVRQTCVIETTVNLTSGW